MKKVLIAIDYHPTAEQVASAGYVIAQRMEAEVCLMHVLAEVGYYGMQYPPFMGYTGYDEMAVDLNVAAEMRQVAEDFVKTAASHLNEEKVSTHMAEGDTARAILDYSREWQADLLVMGTHSHSFVEKLIMGTIASQVLEKTEIPVLMVPVKK